MPGGGPCDVGADVDGRAATAKGKFEQRANEVVMCLRAISRVKVIRVCQPSVVMSESRTVESSRSCGEDATRRNIFMSSYLQRLVSTTVTKNELQTDL